jgi:MFS family permease
MLIYMWKHVDFKEVRVAGVKLAGPQVEGSISSAEGSEVGRSAIRRIAFRLVPFLMLCYSITYLNRVNLSFASVAMSQSLTLTASEYGLGAGLFFASYSLFEIPSNLMLHRLGARRWLARIMLTLGICAAGMSLVEGRTGFYLVRLALGVAEAGFFPGILYFLTLWFPTQYRARIVGMLIATIPLASIAGAPLSALLLSFDGAAGLRGWQWLFLVEAVPAFVLAPLLAIYLQDSPKEARWLPEPEKVWIIGKLESERQESDTRRAYTVLQCLTDTRVLCLAAIFFSNVCLLNGITFFLPQIVDGFALTEFQKSIVIGAPGFLALIVLLSWGRISDLRNERYTHAAIANFLGGAALLLSIVLNAPAPRMVALSAAFACTLAFASPFWAIPPSFLTGRAAAGGMALISALGVTGGFVSPWFIGTMKEITGDFKIGFGVVAMIAMISAVTLHRLGRTRSS